MNELETFDEKGNPVILRPIKLRGYYMLNPLQLKSSSVDFKKIAKDLIVKKMAEEMAEHIFFTETESNDGGLIIESKTYFYGL